MRHQQMKSATGVIRVLALVLVASACTVSHRTPRVNGATRSTTTTTPTAKTPTKPTATPPSTRTPRVAKSYDPLLRATAKSLARFWTKELPGVYDTDYKNLTGGLYAYSEGSAIPPCNGQSMPYLVLQQNAFYCQENDFIAWDDQGLFPRLEKRYGPFLLSIVLAHEWGHAIQQRSDIFTYGGIEAEQQADCFAGAWAASLNKATDPALVVLRDRNLDRVLSGLIEFRDQLGITAATFGAHGTAFDRIRAFQDGFTGGTSTCADYEDNLPELVAIPFRSFKERFRGGNMPFGQVLPSIRPEVVAYWKAKYGLGPFHFVNDAADFLCMTKEVLPTGISRRKTSPQISWCADDQTVHYSETSLRKLYDTNGDFGVATVVALQWAAVEQSSAGQDLTTKASALQSICQVGGWTGSLYDENDPEASALSPGDVDEAVRVLLEITSENPAIGSGFERVSAFRKGVLGSATAC